MNGDSLVNPKTGANNNYNFAIARVRLKGSSGPSAAANNVKVFFRLFTTQTFDTDFINSPSAVTSADPNVTYPPAGTIPRARCASPIPPSPDGYQPPSAGPGKHDRERCSPEKSSACATIVSETSRITLLSEEGHEHWFRGREPKVEELVNRAWIERTVISVLVKPHGSDSAGVDHSAPMEMKHEGERPTVRAPPARRVVKAVPAAA